jgi:hypothetical protein
MPAHQKVEFASLSPEQVARVHQLEKKLGALVVAYKTPLRPALLSNEQIAELRELEKAMPGVCLVAYQA